MGKRQQFLAARSSHFKIFFAPWRETFFAPLRLQRYLAHVDLGRLARAVFAAYGWPAVLTDDEILAQLLAENLTRANKTLASG